MINAAAGDASPSHSQSELSTVPNTPREESPRPGPVHPVNTTRFEASPSSTTSGDNKYDIQPTWPKMIDATKAAAVATWKNERLSGLFLDVHWHIPSNKTFFKLRATVPLANVPGRRNGKTSVYVFIYPERICQVSIDFDSSGTMPRPESVSQVHVGQGTSPCCAQYAIRAQEYSGQTIHR